MSPLVRRDFELLIRSIVIVTDRLTAIRDGPYRSYLRIKQSYSSPGLLPFLTKLAWPLISNRHHDSHH